MKLSSKMIHTGVHSADPHYGSVVPPIYPSSTFIFPNAKEGAKRFAGKSKGMIYSRFTNPTVKALEKRLTDLEKTESAIATSSGMAAITTTLLHFLSKGERVIAHRVVYGGTFELLSKVLPRYGIDVVFLNLKQTDNLKRFADEKTKLIYFESPTNPLLEIIDIEKITSFAKKKGILTIFDNTFAPPPMQQAKKLGVDIIIHSLTKYINGHSDVVAGAIMGSEKLLSKLYWKSFIPMGPCLSPFAAYLVLRGMETMTVRIKKQCTSALKIASFLASHPKITRVYYPHHSSHPQYRLAKKQMKMAGSVMSFDVKGDKAKGEKLVNSMKLFNLAVSLGSAESLIEHPASMTHSEMSEKQLKKAGISPGLVRIAVGLENTEDLINDLKQALNKI